METEQMFVFVLEGLRILQRNPHGIGKADLIVSHGWVPETWQPFWLKALEQNGALQSDDIYRLPEDLILPSIDKLLVPVDFFVAQSAFKELYVSALPNDLRFDGAPSIYTFPGEVANSLAEYLGIRTDKKWQGVRLEALVIPAIARAGLTVSYFEDQSKIFFAGWLPINIRVHNLVFEGPWFGGVFW